MNKKEVILMLKDIYMYRISLKYRRVTNQMLARVIGLA